MITVNQLLTAVTFLGVFFGVFGFNLLIADVLDRSRKRRLKELESEILERQKVRARDTLQSQSSTLGTIVAAAESEQFAEHETMRQRLDAMLERADMQISAVGLFGAGSALAALAGGAVYVLTMNLAFAVLAVILAFSIPFLYVAYRRQQREEMLRSQLPDSLELMSRVLRAGQTITQAMHAVAEEFPPPVSGEFALCYEQQNLGLSTDLALRDLARRTGLLEIQIFVLALLVHRQTGGNLTELLDKLSTLIRSRYRIRGKIKTLTAEGRMQAVILLALPVFMYIVLLIISHEYAMELLEHPSLIAGALGMMGAGALWIRNIINFDF